MSNDLLTIPPLELARLWGELTECYHGVNGYGGNTAEIYSYRFQSYTPGVHNRSFGEKRESISDKERMIYLSAKHALVALCRLFADEYGCRVEIDGHVPDTWACTDIRFDHRAHVKVKRR